MKDQFSNLDMMRLLVIQEKTKSILRKYISLSRAIEFQRNFDRTKSVLMYFRDVEDARLGDLSEVLKDALNKSDFLIVICSPNSCISNYVAEEITLLW